jgi:ferredoxin
MGKIKVIHYPENCIGCNSCCLMAPDQWRINDETGRAELIGAEHKGNCDVLEIQAQDLANNLSAAAACPVQIIKVEKND